MRYCICKKCKQKKPHHAKGLCLHCYVNKWAKDNSERYNATKREYRKNHKEYTFRLVAHSIFRRYLRDYGIDTELKEILSKFGVKP